jgi:hypothetical protein
VVMSSRQGGAALANNGRTRAYLLGNR